MGLVSALFGWLLFQQSYLRIPDGYEIDVDRDPPRFAAPCDRDNVVSIDLPTAKFLAGAGFSLRYDEEDRSMGNDADVVRFRFEWKW
jgi:hypothetical protein